MTINQRLFEIMTKKGIKQTELANALNIKQQIVNNWKTRGTDPAMEYLPKICEMLNISWEYLVTGQEGTISFTKEEKMLVAEFRCLNDTGRKQSLEYIRAMKGIHPVEIPEEKII